jgi:hypothetical protein
VDNGEWYDIKFFIPDGRWFTRHINGGDFRVVRTGTPFHELSIASVKAENIGTNAIAKPKAQATYFHRCISMSNYPSRNLLKYRPLFQCFRTIQCLQAISQNTSGDYEVIVVDDGSPDFPCSWLAGIPRLRFVRLERNSGFSIRV